MCDASTHSQPLKVEHGDISGNDTDIDRDILEAMEHCRIQQEFGECEFIPEAGKRDLNKVLFERCTKNPGHKNFISIKDFNASNLPEGFQTEELVEFIHRCADLTVRIRVKNTSKNRPKLFPDKQLGAYPHHNKTILCNRVGSGFVVKVSAESGDCPCLSCVESKVPSTPWWRIVANTATHVIFDSQELQHSEVDFFYDNEEKELNNIVTLFPVSMTSQREIELEFGVESDTAKFACSTHDAAMVDRLKACLERKQELRDEGVALPDEYVALISHPHGHVKKLTIGPLREIVIQESDANSGIFFKVCKQGLQHEIFVLGYATDSCPGSSGSQVIWMKKDYVHSGSIDKDMNMSTKNVKGLFLSVYPYGIPVRREARHEFMDSLGGSYTHFGTRMMIQSLITRPAWIDKRREPQLYLEWEDKFMDFLTQWRTMQTALEEAKKAGEDIEKPSLTFDCWNKSVQAGMTLDEVKAEVATAFTAIAALDWNGIVMESRPHFKVIKDICNVYYGKMKEVGDWLAFLGFPELAMNTLRYIEFGVDLNTKWFIEHYILSACWISCEQSQEFIKGLIRGGGIKLLFTEIRGISYPRSVTHRKFYHILNACVSIIYYIARYCSLENDNEGMSLLKNAGTQEVLMRVHSTLDEDFLKTISLIALAFLVPDLETLKDTKGAIKVLVSWIRLAVAEDEDNKYFKEFSVSELVLSLSKLTYNQHNCMQIISAGTIPELVKLLKSDFRGHQRVSANCIWSLCLNDEARACLLQEPDLWSRCETLRNSDDLDGHILGLLWASREGNKMVPLSMLELTSAIENDREERPKVNKDFDPHTSLDEAVERLTSVAYDFSITDPLVSDWNQMDAVLSCLKSLPHYRTQLIDLLVALNYADSLRKGMNRALSLSIILNVDLCIRLRIRFAGVFVLCSCSCLFAKEFAEGGGVKLLTWNMAYKPYLEQIEHTEVVLYLHCVASGLYYMSKYPELKDHFFEAKTKEVLALTSMCLWNSAGHRSLMTLALISDQSERAQLEDTIGCIGELVVQLNNCWFLEEELGQLNFKEICECLDKLAVNDKNKIQIVNSGGLNVFALMFQSQSPLHQEAPLDCVMTMISWKVLLPGIKLQSNFIKSLKDLADKVEDEKMKSRVSFILISLGL